MARHNELRDEVSDLAVKAFTPTHMRDNTKIFTGRKVQGGGEGKATRKGNESPPPYEGGEKGDLLIRDIWTQETDSIHDMRVVSNDAVSYQSKTPEKCMDANKR